MPKREIPVPKDMPKAEVVDRPANSSNDHRGESGRGKKPGVWFDEETLAVCKSVRGGVKEQGMKRKGKERSEGETN